MAVKTSDAGATPATDAASKDANLAPATDINPSGAPDQIVPDVDLSHPAVDANPRANTSEIANRIDFNDPKLSGSEAVAKALGLKAGDDKKND